MTFLRYAQSIAPGLVRLRTHTANWRSRVSYGYQDFCWRSVVTWAV